MSESDKSINENTPEKCIGWYMDLDEYIRQGEPAKTEKSNAWKTAIGLQDVDGLKTSDYLLQTAREHIEGKINITDAKKRVQTYYEQRQDRKDYEAGTMEADIVSTRIAELLGETTFQFSPAEWQNIHKRLFSGVFDHAGRFRTYNISKKEWVLNHDTVIYAGYDSIKTTLDYDFDTEKNFNYEGLSVPDSIKHIAKFTSDIWQIHPFGEGNTRSTAVFIIKYLKSFGLPISNDVFAENSWYFRNALVRANYNDWSKDINATTYFLELFFENLLLGTNYQLKNRYLHVDYKDYNKDNSKCKNCTLDYTMNCTLEELAIINAIMDNPRITQKQLSEKIGKSERTIKSRTVQLQEKGIIKRVNGKRNGQWEILQ